MSHAVEHLPTFDTDGNVRVIIETPQGSRNKFKYEPELGIFVLSTVLPVGANFPFNFGFVPSTAAPDGDPIDILVLMDTPAVVGCLLTARLIGVIEAEQTENGTAKRNDRLIAVASESRDHREVRRLKDLNSNELAEIEHFFVSYNEVKGKKFKVLGQHGPNRARKVLAGAQRSGKRARRKRA